MKYLEELVYQINNYDEGAPNKLRDLICYLSDNKEYQSNPIYRETLFDAAQIMRTFGYNVQNNITIDNLENDNTLYNIKHQAIQNYYASRIKLYRNNLLDKRQKEIIDCFMNLKEKRLIISAPTSFGKTFLLRELLYLNRNRYNNILLVFPTIALLNENTVQIKKFIKDLELNFKVINNVYSKIDVEGKNIFILTPERTLKLLADYESINIDFFFFDEVYKIDEDFYKDEECSQIKPTELILTAKPHSRAQAFRITLYLLSKNVREFYIAGPYLNLGSSKKGFKRFLKTCNIEVMQVEFEPTLRIEYDAWKQNGKQLHPVLGHIDVKFDYGSGCTTDNKIRGITEYIKKNELGKVIFYCSNPSNAMRYAQKLIDNGPYNSLINKHRRFLNHLKKRYGIKYSLKGKSIVSSDYWSLIRILSYGYGVHHGKFPKYIQKEILNMFNSGDIDYLFCTSTIIEGVNTNAKNIVIINNSVGSNTMTSFALKNIKGRAGRYYHHFIGRVFFTDKKQRDIDAANDMKLNFSTFDDDSLVAIDYDNAELEDLSKYNKAIKENREKNFNKNVLPDKVFIKNRLFPRDVQEKLVNYLTEKGNFNKFISLIEKSVSVQVFLDEKMMNKIVDAFSDVQIIDDKKGIFYKGVISNYSINRFKGLMEYQLENKIVELEKDIDKAYLTVFEQIRTIVEYEIPRLLCLFESTYQQAGRLNGYNTDLFDMSPIIKFFELGVKTTFGLFLVEYGFPIDAIREIEETIPVLMGMELEERIAYVSQNLRLLNKILDEYEFELIKSAILEE